MSDEEALGKVFFINRRIWVLIVAIGFMLYGIYSALYFITFAYVRMATTTPSHCSGPGCSDVLTCEGTRAASYHFRVCVAAIGSLFFGIYGTNAIQNKYAKDMYHFAWALIVLAIVYFSVMMLDGAYMVICGNEYSYNVIAEAVLWPLPGPVNVGIKHEIRQLDTYPKKYVDSLCYHNVFTMFATFYLLRVAFFAFAAYQSFFLAQRFHYGDAGMGANFSIEGWRKRLMMRYEINEVGYNTFGMAMATGMDVGWEESEFHLHTPMRKPHWYRGMMPGGMMPGAAAQAYDGFRDDRRNVLL
jgi:hypothetical protein